MIPKLSQCFNSDVISSETEIKLFRPHKLFQNYFSNTNMLENIHELQ